MEQRDRTCVFFVPLIKHELYNPSRILCLYDREIITSGSVDNTFSGFLVAAAVAIFEVISKALTGSFNALVAKFLPALAQLLPKFLKKLPSPFACIVLLETVLDFFQTEQ